MNSYWRPWSTSNNPMTQFQKHETNCVVPLISVCLIWKELDQMLQDWESKSGVVLEREMIQNLKKQAITAAEEVTKEANLAQAIQIENKVTQIVIKSRIILMTQ